MNTPAPFWHSTGLMLIDAWKAREPSRKAIILYCFTKKYLQQGLKYTFNAFISKKVTFMI